jgi:hypothetical protein
MQYKLTILFAATLLMGGCMRLTATAAIDPCDFWRPVSWSAKDTPTTVEGVKINNARQKAWCGGSKSLLN